MSPVYTLEYMAEKEGLIRLVDNTTATAKPQQRLVQGHRAQGFGVLNVT